MPKTTTTKSASLDSLADLPPELAPAAEAAAAYSAAHASAAAAAEQRSMILAATAYAIMLEDAEGGKELAPWADYLTRAADSTGE